MISDQIDVFNPYAARILDIGVDDILEHTETYPNPFLQILGARWLIAQLHDQTRKTTTCWLAEQSKAQILIVPDFFLNDLLTRFGDVEGLRQQGKRVVVFSDLPSLSPNGFYTAAMNMFLSARSGALNQSAGFHYQSFHEQGFTNLPIVPMGCSQDWLPEPNHYDKAIFLDEPHQTVLDNLSNKDDIRVALFLHALETCKRLHSHGYEIYTFCRTSSEALTTLYHGFPFLRLLRVGDWIPFNELVRCYARATLFYSFFTETFGYPIYENFQLGNGVITYAETFDAYRLMHMQRGVLLSVYTSPELSAQLIDEYFVRLKTQSLRGFIRKDAKALFSAETFFSRLRNSSAFCAMLKQ